MTGVAGWSKEVLPSLVRVGLICPLGAWAVLQDPETDKPKGFGFCEFVDAEGVLRAQRLLNNLALDGQELLVKCNTATQTYVDQYQRRKEEQVSQAQASTLGPA